MSPLLPLLFVALTLPSPTFLQGASDSQLSQLESSYATLQDSARQAPPEKAREAADTLKDVERPLTLIHNEQTFRTNIARPLCAAEWGIQQARETIREEKSNPARVVNLYTIHEAGRALAYWSKVYKSYLSPYARFRHHAYTGSESEGTCQEEAGQ